jgi:hypothetical protein
MVFVKHDYAKNAEINRLLRRRLHIKSRIRFHEERKSQFENKLSDVEKSLDERIAQSKWTKLAERKQ